MSAMSQQSQSDSAVVGTLDREPHRPLRKLDVPAVDADENPLESEGEDWVHEKSKLLLGNIFK